MFKKIKEDIIYRLRLQREIYMAHVFRDSIVDVDWLKNKSFSPSGAAANYSFLYVLFRILNDIQPVNIIEFGIGQTTRLTSQYVSNKNTEANLIVVEDDEKWLNVIKAQIPVNDRMKFLRLDLETQDYDGIATTFYRELTSCIKDKKFDLIILDGPQGVEGFSRAGILGLIPENLSESFIIIVDDCQRQGEQNTYVEILKKLSSLKINCDHCLYGGLKKQNVIFSPDLAFIKSF